MAWVTLVYHNWVFLFKATASKVFVKIILPVPNCPLKLTRQMDGGHFATQHGIINLLTKYAASMVFAKSLTQREVIVTSVPRMKMLTRWTVITWRSYQPATTRKPLLYAKINPHPVSTLCINEVALKERMKEWMNEWMNLRHSFRNLERLIKMRKLIWSELSLILASDSSLK